jgi:8-oxo-dGTP diphosphatase
VSAIAPPPSAASPLVEVVAGVIERADGTFLLARRPPGKVYAGYWEFPGGKVEPGERLDHALARELAEELGIDVTRAYPWMVQRFAYPHAHVQLHFFRVRGWTGEPHPREDQALAWTTASHITVAPVLPANGPILRALALPALLGISCAHLLGVGVFLRRLEDALERGLRMVMIREKGMQPAALDKFCRDVVARCRAGGATVVLNGDPVLAGAVGADGVHLPSQSLMQAIARPSAGFCGASCHDATELARAQDLALDYAVLGPVLPTASHPGQPALGWDRASDLLRGCRIPVYALGAMDEALLERAWSCGAHGIAMMRAAWR